MKFDPVEHTLRKLCAYEVQEAGAHFFVLGKFVWVKSLRNGNWIIRAVKHSPILHYHLVILRDSAYEFDHTAGLEADAWARFLKGGYYTRQYGKKLRHAS